MQTLYRFAIMKRTFMQISKINRCFCVNRNFGSAAPPNESSKENPSNIRPCLMSGIQPTGIPHIGNYFGAIQRWKTLQDTNNYDVVVISIVDLHSITLPQNPDNLRRNILESVASILACGLDGERTILFRQSDVSQHTELGWVLGCLTHMNRLEHLPQWKEKAASSNNTEVPLGLFTYPVLQAADILLYKATEVPVGDDQLKHIELARHLAKLFNNTYGPLFPIPRPLIGEFKRIKSLRNPANKMSKSDKDSKGRIELADSPDEIRDKIRKAFSDCTSNITYEPTDRPGVANLIEMHSACTGLTPDEICEQSLHLDTLGYKNVVADAVIEYLSPIREKIKRFMNDPSHLNNTIKSGCERAKEIAGPTYEVVRQKLGCI